MSCNALVTKHTPTQLVPLTPKLAVAWPDIRKKAKIVVFKIHNLSAMALQTSLTCQHHNLPQVQFSYKREPLSWESDNNSLLLVNHRFPFKMLVDRLSPHLLASSQFKILPVSPPSPTKLWTTLQIQTTRLRQAKAILLLELSSKISFSRSWISTSLSWVPRTSSQHRPPASKVTRPLLELLLRSLVPSRLLQLGLQIPLWSRESDDLRYVFHVLILCYFPFN